MVGKIPERDVKQHRNKQKRVFVLVIMCWFFPPTSDFGNDINENSMYIMPTYKPFR